MRGGSKRSLLFKWPLYNYILCTPWLVGKKRLLSSVNFSFVFFQTSFEGGELVLTSHRIIWGQPGDIAQGLTCLSLHLKYIVLVEEETPSSFGFSKSKKVILHLLEAHKGSSPLLF